MKNSKHADSRGIQKFYKGKVLEWEKMFVNKKRMAVDAKPEFIKLFKSSNMIASKFKLLKFNKQDQWNIPSPCWWI